MKTIKTAIFIRSAFDAEKGSINSAFSPSVSSYGTYTDCSTIFAVYGTNNSTTITVLALSNGILTVGAGLVYYPFSEDYNYILVGG